MSTLINVAPDGGRKVSPHVGLTSDVPLNNTQNEVSVRYAPNPMKKWYVLRATYHREKKAYDYILSKRNSPDGNRIDAECYLPLRHVAKIVKGKRRFKIEPFLPNFLFVYATLETISQILNNDDLNFLNPYYDHFKQDEAGKNPPLTIPYAAMMNFIKVTSVDIDKVKVVSEDQCHFKSGDLVKVTGGEFKGVVGRVARLGGQQRVVVDVKGVCLVSTAYVPTGLLEKIK